MNRTSISMLAACGVLASFPAAAADAELQALREEIAQMKKSYEQRINALEKRLVATEKQAVAASSKAEAATGQAQLAREASRPPTAASAFNPEISLILSGMYNNTSQDPRQDSSGAAGRERRIQGTLPAGGELNPEARAWNLGESELAIAANIDPHFRGTFLAAISPANEIGVEEAHIQTIGLGNGLGVKAGRFFSGIGYANEQHPHAWDFSDAALPYQAFFGPQLGYDGVQLKWVAPTDLFVELGAEFGRARSFPASEGNKNGLMSGSVFAHVGGDLGVAHSWRAGASYFASKPRDRTYDDVDSTNTTVTNSFSGTSHTTVLDLVWKWSPEGSAKERGFKFQGEWFRRQESGDLTYDTTAASLGAATDSFRARQTGFYAQGIWQIMPHWRAGYRYDQLSAATMSVGLVDNATLTAADLPLLQSFTPKRHTAMVDFSPSEFSRIRFQVARDQSRPGVNDNQIWLHYIMSLGAHGAHKF
ncbi:MAG: TonB-dependent receptor [Sulfuritalea sp.]|nr:TonB-dependent receptor [Sulfuritalea sp.]MDP1982255.1 TonB-dependent receptor [Sulfuritalea sp.]